MNVPLAARVPDAAAIATYRRQGFLHTPGLLAPDEVVRLRDGFRAASHAQREAALGGYATPVFRQQVNLWLADRGLLGLALHPLMRATATALAGVPLRLWHDHLLVKAPHNGAPTEFHQDQPYWPHADGDDALSAWVALVDVPFERGCMSYLPGSHERRGLNAQNLTDPRSLFERCPELEWSPRVAIPVRAGDVIWHHARTAHRAEANATDVAREIVSVIYMPRSTRYTGAPHVCTDGAGIAVGEVIQGEMFPEV